MKTQWLILFVLMGYAGISAQENKEHYRRLGYEAKENGDLKSAIRYYEKVLEIDKDDYDACLALARLYFNTGQYQQSALRYRQMLSYDREDVEALHGLGKIMLYTDRYAEAESYLKKAVELNPDYITPYFDLAKTYAWWGKLNKAIEIYNTILEKDHTYSEAWQGIGKMNYWKEKPVSALSFYKKALEWDPTNEEIRKEYHDIRKATRWNISNQTKTVNENEQNFQIRSLSSRFTLNKRLTDLLEWSLNLTADRADRTFFTTPDNELRYYGDIKSSLAFITRYNRLTLYGAYAPTDRLFSAYGIHWKASFEIAKVKITPQADGGYEYFYYWNRAGQKRINASIKINYKAWEGRIETSFGIVDSAFVADVVNNRYENDLNPFSGYGIGISYKILKQIDLKAGFSYAYMNYTYKSPMYYSPLGRKTAGFDLNFYHKFGKFYLYSAGRVHLGEEFYWESKNTGNGNKVRLEKIYIPSDLMAGNFEIGYMPGKWETSLNATWFKTPYYSSLIAGIGFKYFVGL